MDFQKHIRWIPALRVPHLRLLLWKFFQPFCKAIDNWLPNKWKNTILAIQSLYCLRVHIKDELLVKLHLKRNNQLGCHHYTSLLFESMSLLFCFFSSPSLMWAFYSRSVMLFYCILSCEKGKYYKMYSEQAESTKDQEKQRSNNLENITYLNWFSN